MELKDGPDRNPITGFSPIPQNHSGSVYALGTLEELVGKRAMIRAVKPYGSARFLDGLVGTVVGVHPIAPGWVKIDLDRNSRTPHRDWSVAADRLVLIEPEVPHNP